MKRVAASVLCLVAWAAGAAPAMQVGSLGLVPTRGDQETPEGERESDRVEGLRFHFDGFYYGPAQLTFEFTRGVPIVLPGQETIAADQPRYESPVCMAPAPLVKTIRDTIADTDLLGSGLGHDGKMPILLVLNRSSGILDVFTVAGDALLDAEQTGVGRNRTYIGDTPEQDLLQGAIPNRAYKPVSAAVCHGLIVVLCVVSEDLAPPSGDYVEVATAFVVSQDEGVTWDLLHEDSNVDEGWPRGREWCMQNWWPMTNSASPREAYFVATDYRRNPDALGGRTYLFRAQRIDVGSPWTFEPVVITYEAADADGTHFHTAAVLPYEEDGLCVLTSVGDTQFNNCIVKQTRSDRDYTGPGWTTVEDYQGLIGDITYRDWGREANQFVGCAPGSEAGDVLVGADLNNEQIMLIPASDLGEAHPGTQHVYGLGVSDDANRSEVFLICTPTPELRGPYYARYSPWTSGDTPAEAKRLLYSENGVDWAQVFSPCVANFRGCLHGEHLYVDSPAQSLGLRRLGLPTIWKRRPLRVGAGGYQRCVDTPGLTPGACGTIEALAMDDDGRWLFEGDPLDPQPPSCGQVYHVTGDRADPENLVGSIWPAGSADDVGQVIPGEALQLRCWIMNNFPGGNLHPGLELRDTANNICFMRRPVYSTVDKWFPVLGVRPSTIEPGQAAVLRVLTTAAMTTADTDFFLALDALVEGVGLADYALPPDATPDETGTPYPDELAAITGLECGPQWTITLAAQLPPDSWDGNIVTTDRWPLATIWGDENNYIELLALSPGDEGYCLAASLVIDGVEEARLESRPTYWTRGTSVLVSIADAGPPLGIQMTASIGGQEAHESDYPGTLKPSLPVPPTEIRFGSHDGVSGDGTAVHVTPMLWWGGEVRPNTLSTALERQLLLRTLSFLEPVPGDIDGDGDVDQSDLGLLLASYELDDGGDIDGDGDTDQADLGLLLANYEYGR